MTLERLKIFASVAKYLSVTQAAGELHMSQPAVSQNVKQLQDELSVALFRKRGRGIELTSSGQLLVGKAQQILHQVDNLKLNLNAGSSPEKCIHLAVGASHGLSEGVVPFLLSSLRKQNPRLSLTLRTGTVERIEAMVVKSRIEVGLIDTPPRSPYLMAEYFRQHRAVAFAAPSWPHHKKRELRLSDLPRTPFVIRGGGAQKTKIELLMSLWEAEGRSPNIALKCDSAQAVKIAVTQGVGVGILYQHVVEEDIRRGIIRRIEFKALDISTQSFIVYHRDRELSMGGQHFLEFLRRRRDGRTRG